MNRFSKTGLTLLFILVLFMPSYIHADPPTLNIPPTNAFDKIHTDNATVSAQNFSMPIIFKGDNGISIHGNNATHTIIINGTNCTAIQVNDVTSLRTNDTVYHNTSGKTLMVSISFISTPVSGISDADIIARVENVNPPISVIADVGLLASSPAGTQGTFSVIFLVPNGYYYIADTGGNGPNISIQRWIENLDPSCGAKTTLTQGTYNQTLANNTPININGNRINFINGTGNPVHIENSNSGQQVNVTISSSGASGVTQLNGFTGKINLTRTYSNNTEIINDTGNLQISVKPNVVLINGSKQTFTKSLDLGGPTNNQDIFDDNGIIIRTPNHSFAYTLNASQLSANRTLNLPLIVKQDTLAVLGLDQVWGAGQDFGSKDNNQDIFDDIGIVIRNPLHSKAYTISAGAITQNVTLSLPITNSSTDTLAVLKTPETFTAPITFTLNATRAGINIGSNTLNPTNSKNGDLWINAFQLMWKDNSGNLRTSLATTTTQFMQNKLMLTNNIFEDVTDQTKQLLFLLSGMTSGKAITISGHQTTTQTINIPNIVSTDQFTTAVAQNFTSDANAITGLPISNHYCGWYFVTGNSTFRLICNFNGIAHVLGKQ